MPGRAGHGGDGGHAGELAPSVHREGRWLVGEHRAGGVPAGTHLPAYSENHTTID